MTTELEEQFFKVFGIKPQKLCFNGDCAAKDEIGYDEKICDDRCVYIERKYPEITDRKLLEMICIYNSTYTNGYTNYSLLNERNVEKLKEQILKNCLIVRDDIKHQIQQLFKEGE